MTKNRQPHNSQTFILLNLSNKNLRITQDEYDNPRCVIDLRLILTQQQHKGSRRARKLPRFPILDEYRMFCLTEAAQKSLMIENAGGNSAYSEAVSIQYFVDLGTRDIVCEREVQYDFYGFKMVDFIGTIDKTRFGVSVTRAMTFRKPFDLESAETLLYKKLNGLVLARNAVSKKHRFFVSVLHVLCQTKEIQEFLRIAYQTLDKSNLKETLKGSLILVLTVCDDKQVYFEKRRKKKLENT